MLYKASYFADYTAFFMLHILQKILGTANVVFLSVHESKKQHFFCLSGAVGAFCCIFGMYSNKKNNKFHA